MTLLSLRVSFTLRLVRASVVLLALAISRASMALASDAEFRGAWVASVYNLDWPSKAGLSAGEQKAQLRALLDRAAQLKLNAILLQVRPESDALYSSRMEPWSGRVPLSLQP